MWSLQYDNSSRSAPERQKTRVKEGKRKVTKSQVRKSDGYFQACQHSFPVYSIYLSLGGKKCFSIRIFIFIVLVCSRYSFLLATWCYTNIEVEDVTQQVFRLFILQLLKNSLKMMWETGNTFAKCFQYKQCYLFIITTKQLWLAKSSS